MVELKFGAPRKKPEMVIGKRWDKLRAWRLLKEDIETKLLEPEKFDSGLTLEIGPQLLHTLRHRSMLRCMNHFISKLGEVFTTHYNKGAVQRISVWMVDTMSRDSVCQHIRFDTPYELTSITYVAKHRVYVAFSTDLYLRMFLDANNNFIEICQVPCAATVLCLVYNREDDEIYAGGVGVLEEWNILGAEHAASLVPGKKFTTDITRNDWVRDIKLDKKNNQMFAMHGNGIIVFNLKTRKQTHRLPNRHEGPLKCCCYFPQGEYLITGGADGKIKIFNSTAFNLIHVFIGHHGPVTSVVPHKKDTLLFSCSHDGTVRLWWMDSLRIFTRLEIGEKIYQLSLLGDTEFFFQTEKDIMIYTQNQFYQFFASVESETYKLMRCRGKGKPNKILVSTEDGSVRLFSPVTGLTLTIIYPMPSFQILTNFAYDIHQDRLYTTLHGGQVLVYNTATNPCRSEELWVPSCKDEQVVNLLLVTVEFMCEGGTDVDNLVFAGLNNGQIILCEALVCSLECPIQAHEGALTCFEASTPAIDSGNELSEYSNTIISGGTDNFVKIWVINISTRTRRPLVDLSLLLKIFLPAIPTHICMYADMLAVSIKALTRLGWRWRLVMYMLSSSSRGRWGASCRTSQGGMIIPFQVTHQPDEDHILELTSLDKCPIINVFLSAGKDGYVKIWNRENELIRELNFATPIYASCFANDRGDLLVGFGAHVCSVSVINYLPLENLKRLIHTAFKKVKDDSRELPVNFDHKAEPWLDLEKVRKYPILILERRKQKIEEEVIEKLKKASEKEAAEKFVIFVDGGTTQIIRKDFADRLLNWARGKNKFKLGFKALAPQPSATEQTQEVDDTNVKKKGSVPKQYGRKGETDASIKEEIELEERKYLDSKKLIEIYPSAVGKALKQLETQWMLGPIEMRLLEEKKLLERDPIIAPDGYIPNSVIRRKLKPPKRETPKLERKWKIKPVPKADPKFLPSGWEEEKETTPAWWEDSQQERKFDLTPSPKSISPVEETHESPTSESPEDEHYEFQTESPAFQLKSKRIDMIHPDLEIPDYVRRKRKSAVDKKSMKLTSLAVDEDSSDIRVKEAKVKKGVMQNDLVQQLMEEKWMPQIEGSYEYEDVLKNLLMKLDDNNPMVYDSVMKYLAALFKELGIPDSQLDECIAKLGANLESINIAIRKHTLRGLQAIGQGRADVITMILPKLIDPEEPVRRSAAEAIQILTGADNKEKLLIVLDELGITGGLYSSKEDEEFAFRVLAERFGEGADPELLVRIQDWVQGTTPGLIDDDLNPEDLDQLWKDGSRSRKSSMYQTREQSFMSEKSEKRASKGSRPGSRRTDRSTARRREGDDRSMVSERSMSSRRGSRASERFTPKDPNLLRYYDREGKLQSGFHEEDEGKVPVEDSDYKTISHVASSQIMERLSGQDSGISRDMSEYSRGGKAYPYGVSLSPVKSEGSVSSDKQHPKDWRKFFELPTAIERHQMELIKREMAQGKLKHTTLPPISYFAADLPMLPGEAGTRLLQTVRVGEKVPTSGDGRHRIESVPGKLAVHTQNESAGLSSFGIIQMQWTTGVPTVKDAYQPPQRIPQQRFQSTDSQYLPPLQSQLSHLSRIRQGTSDAELHLPNLVLDSPTVSHRLSPSFEWELPLPPPPPKESRTIVPHIKKEHDTYCKYYQLVKKKLHLYTSKQREKSLSLPAVVAKGMMEKHQSDSQQTRKSREPSRLVLGTGQILPPIKLGQLINI